MPNDDVLDSSPTASPPGEFGPVTTRQLRDLLTRWRGKADEYRAAAQPNPDRARRCEGMAAGYASAAIDLENLLRGEPLRG